MLHKEINNRIPIEIIVAEDGSTDGTKAILSELSKRIPIKIIFGEERKGYSQGLIDALVKVKTKFVVFVDSDGQHLASDFWNLYNLRNCYDIVTGWRINRADSFHRRLISKSFQLLAKNLFKIPKFNDMTAPYRLVNSTIAKRIAEKSKHMKESFWTEFTIRASYMGFSSKEVPVTHRIRVGGGSNVYKPTKLVGIVISQLKGMFSLKMELRNQIITNN